VIFGIDVSHRQSGLDWSEINPSVQNAPRICDFAFVKLTEGATFNDPYANTHAKKASAVGIPFGYYHYARPEVDDAIQEAQAFAEALKRAPVPHLRPVLDIEHRGTAKDLTRWALSWCHHVEDLTGLRPIIYTYRSFTTVFNNNPIILPSITHSITRRIADYDLWLADYRTNDDHGHLVRDVVFEEDADADGPFGVPIMHQFTGTGRVNGYHGDIDRNSALSLKPLRVGYRRPTVWDTTGLKQRIKTLEDALATERYISRSFRDKLSELRVNWSKLEKGLTDV